MSKSVNKALHFKDLDANIYAHTQVMHCRLRFLSYHQRQTAVNASAEDQGLLDKL